MENRKMEQALATALEVSVETSICGVYARIPLLEAYRLIMEHPDGWTAQIHGAGKVRLLARMPGEDAVMVEPIDLDSGQLYGLDPTSRSANPYPGSCASFRIPSSLSNGTT